METSEVLNKAADLIEERGWVKGPSGWLLRAGGLCLEGGICAALEVNLTDALDARELYLSPAYLTVAAYLGLEPLPATAPIKDALWGWNDTDGRTQGQVIATLRAAAVIAAARESATQPVPVAVSSGAVV